MFLVDKMSPGLPAIVTFIRLSAISRRLCCICSDDIQMFLTARSGRSGQHRQLGRSFVDV